MDYKEAGSWWGVWEGGGRTLHSSGSKWGPVPRSRKTMIHLLAQFQQYALIINKHLNYIITKKHSPTCFGSSKPHSGIFIHKRILVATT